MSGPTSNHHADHACYADSARQHSVTIRENVQIAKDTFRVRFDCPEIARQIVPGQFVMLRLTGYGDPLLGRPLALYDTVLTEQGEPIGLDVVYLTVGKLTSQLASFTAGQKLEIWGPLGNGFAQRPCDHLVMVAGGIGQTPMMALARQAVGQRRYGQRQQQQEIAACRVTFCYGARTSAYLAGIEDFERLGVDVRVSTDDGSAGHLGLVTEVLAKVLAEQQKSVASGRLQIVCCGPERMMEAVSELAIKSNVPCQVSLETPMACGIGICFSCVTKVRQPDGAWDYRRTCVEGPIFEAEEIVW